jgi:hypothetical protein
MRTNVTFRHPAEFVPLSDEDGILAVRGAQWFASILRRVPGLKLDEELCQEDWGVVVFVKRHAKCFWIGLSYWSEGEWLAHLHHGSFAWVQRLSASGNAELRRVVADLHAVLVSDPALSSITWYEESEMSKAEPRGYSTPDGP